MHERKAAYLLYDRSVSILALPTVYFGIKIGGIHFILHAGHTAPPTKQRNLQDGITASDAEVCLP